MPVVRFAVIFPGEAGGGHFNVIYGYDPVHQDVDLGDPWYGNQVLPLASLISNYQGAGSWDYSYRTN